MKSRWLRYQPIIQLSLGLLLVFLISLIIPLIHPVRVMAEHPHSSAAERINNNIRLHQLQRDVRRLNQTSPRNFPTNINGVSTPQRLSIPTNMQGSEPQWEQLATLTVELKDRIKVLEERVAQLESALQSQ